MYLDAALKRRLKEAAARQGATEAFILREALRRFLDGAPVRLPKPVGKCRDGGVAHRADEALEELGFGRR